MKIKTRALGALLGMCAFGVLATAAVAADRPYTEGVVIDVVGDSHGTGHVRRVHEVCRRPLQAIDG